MRWCERGSPLPVPASGVCNNHATPGLKAMAIIGMVFLEEAVTLALVPASSKVLAKWAPKLLAADHILEVGHPAQNRPAEGMVDGGQHEGWRG